MALDNDSSITIQVPSGKATEILEAIATLTGWNASLKQKDGLTQLSKSDFAQRQLQEYVKNQYRQYKVNVASQSIDADFNAVAQ